MSLITCPDCGTEVSDRAPVCIHCGGPLRDSTLQSARRVSSDLIRGALSAITARLKMDRAEEELKSDECLVPIFLLPIGVGVDDYVPYYQFDKLLTELRVKKLVRPKLQVWACRHDVRRGKLAASLTADFIGQLRHQRQAELAPVLAAKGVQVTQLAGVSKDAAEGARIAASAAGASALLMLALTNPIVDLALLTVAVLGGSRASVDLARKAWSDTRRATTETDINAARVQLERELTEKAGEITHAVDSLEIFCHPVLLRVYEDICAVESQPAPPPPTDLHPRPPELIDALQYPAYIDALPNVYRPLVLV